MRHLLIIGGALAALTTTSFAADMPIAAPEAAVVTETYDWSGAYLGAHGGWAWGESETLATDEIDGFVIGGQFGYNFQWDSFVLGLEVDASFSDQERVDGAFSIEGDYLASIRGRLGFALDRFLVYGTGGAALAGATFAIDGFGEDELSHFGWVAGGGVEYAITDNITFGVEYLHYEFGDEEVVIPPFAPIDADLSTDVVRGRLSVKLDGLFN